MNFTDQQIEQAFDSLPDVTQDMLFTPETENTVQKIGIQVGLLSEQLEALTSATNFAIMGLLSEPDLETEIKNNFHFSDTQTKDLVQKISTEILAPINSLRLKALAEQKANEEKEKLEALEDEADKQLLSGIEAEPQEAPSEYSSEAPVAPPAPVIQPAPPAPPRVWEKTPDIAPDNLPTEETTESFLPNLTPKTVSQTPSDGVHPFEQKMKQVFTGSIPANGDLVLETPSPSPTQTLPEQKLVAQAPRPADPYREPIE